MILTDSRAAVHLYRAIEHGQRHPRRRNLDHRDLLHRSPVAECVHHVRRLQRQQPHLLELDAAPRDRLLRRAVPRQELPKGAPRLGAGAQRREGALGDTDAPHAVVYASRAEPRLRHREAAALLVQQVGDRHAHVAEGDLRVAVGRVVVPKHAQHADDIDARRVHRHEHHRLLPPHGRAGGVRFAAGPAAAHDPTHDDGELAARVARAGRPHLAPVDDVLVSLPLDARLHVRRVRARALRLRHRKARADLSAQQRLQPRLLLLARAKVREELHVARVGSGAVEHLGAPLVAAHQLRERRVVERAQPGPLPDLGAAWQKEVPQPGRARLCLELVHKGDGRPAAAGGGVRCERLPPAALVWQHVLRDEGPRAVEELPPARREGEGQRVVQVQRRLRRRRAVGSRGRCLLRRRLVAAPAPAPRHSLRRPHARRDLVDACALELPLLLDQLRLALERRQRLLGGGRRPLGRTAARRVDHLLAHRRERDLRGLVVEHLRRRRRLPLRLGLLLVVAHAREAERVGEQQQHGRDLAVLRQLQPLLQRSRHLRLAEPRARQPSRAHGREELVSGERADALPHDLLVVVAELAQLGAELEAEDRVGAEGRHAEEVAEQGELLPVERVW
mmetsp:Transcript_33357/g.99573  ORF Transcript_33357/g.99573 Transcript_33357/m.99573 type:complete len:619 (-) Transcript_33357:565-2421(-)